MAAPRLFFALWPDAATRAALVSVQQQLAAQVGGRSSHSDDLHITLAFLGAVPVQRLPCVYAAGDGVRALVHQLVLTRQGYWPGPRVAWLAPGATPPELARLVDDLWQRLGPCDLVREARPYRPHVTLLRKAGSLPDAGMGDVIAWPAADFVLAQSIQAAPGASRYRILRRWPLGPGGGGDESVT